MPTRRTMLRIFRKVALGKFSSGGYSGIQTELVSDTTGSTCVISAIVLILCGVLAVGAPPVLSWIAIPVDAGLTLLILPFMLIMDWRRADPFTSRLNVELPLLSILSVLWIVAGGAATTILTVVAAFRKSPFIDPATATAANVPISVLCFLCACMLLVYVFMIVWLAVRARKRGHNVWRSSVKNANFFEPASAGDGGDKDLAMSSVQQDLLPSPVAYPAHPRYPEPSVLHPDSRVVAYPPAGPPNWTEQSRATHSELTEVPSAEPPVIAFTAPRSPGPSLYDARLSDGQVDVVRRLTEQGVPTATDQ